MEELFENIFRIPVKLPDSPLKELNSYLIRDSERSLLIDTGFRLPACKEALISGLTELGENTDSVDIFLTHMHADHSGLAAEIAGEDRRIFLSKSDGLLLQGLSEARLKWFGGMEKDILTGMPLEIVENMASLNPALMFAPISDAKYAEVRDGALLYAGGYKLRCISTPGHTPGHMCLWEEQNGLMFTGDHVLFDITPNITTWPSVSDSLGDYIESLRAIRKYPVKTALPGHRKTGDFHARIDELLGHHKTRLADIEQIIHSSPGLTAYEIAGMMRWRIRADNWDEFPAPQKIFAVGECMSHLDYLRLRGAISRERDDTVYRYYGLQ